MGRSLQALSSGKFYFQEDFIFAGAQSEGSAPHSTPFPLTTNLNHFYPVAERSDSCVNPAGGIDLVAAGIRSTANGCTKIIKT